MGRTVSTTEREGGVTEHIAIYVTKEEREKLESLAKEEDRTVSYLVRRLILDELFGKKGK